MPPNEDSAQAVWCVKVLYAAKGLYGIQFPGDAHFVDHMARGLNPQIRQPIHGLGRT